MIAYPQLPGWKEPETGPAVAIPEQQAVALYWSNKGNLVIRQERSWCQDEDTYIVVERANVQSFLYKLCDFVGIPAAVR